MLDMVTCWPLLEILGFGFPCEGDTFQIILPVCPLLRKWQLATVIRSSDIISLSTVMPHHYLAILWCSRFLLETNEPEDAITRWSPVHKFFLDPLDEMFLSRMPKL